MRYPAVSRFIGAILLGLYCAGYYVEYPQSWVVRNALPINTLGLSLALAIPFLLERRRARKEPTRPAATPFTDSLRYVGGFLISLQLAGPYSYRPHQWLTQNRVLFAATGVMFAVVLPALLKWRMERGRSQQWP